MERTDGATGANGDWLAERFEGHRGHLRAVAYRMLGSASEAEDAVQEAWLRLDRTGDDEIANLGGWLTTVVSRVCLDMLRARTSRREAPLPDGDAGPEPVATSLSGAPASADPEREAIMADAVGAALLVVLEALTPAERLAFVLHDLFAVPFDEIAPILGRSPAATRQLASRARRRVRGAGDGGPDLAETGHDAGGGPDAGHDDRGHVAPADAVGHRAIVDAFLAAAREGRFEDLVALLAPDVVLRADPTAVAWATAAAGKGAPPFAAEIHGADAVAELFNGRARAARPALVEGAHAAAFAPGGVPRSAIRFTIAADGRVAAIDVVADPATVAGLDIVILAIA